VDLDVKRADLNNLHSWRKNLEKVFKYLFRSSETSASSDVRAAKSGGCTTYHFTEWNCVAQCYCNIHHLFVYMLISQWLIIFFYEQTTLHEGNIPGRY
jgi:hypothetical protein